MSWVYFICRSDPQKILCGFFLPPGGFPGRSGGDLTDRRKCPFVLFYDDAVCFLLATINRISVVFLFICEREGRNGIIGRIHGR